MDESRALLIQRDSDKPNNGLKSTISSESYEDSAQFQLKEQDQYVTYGAINHIYPEVQVMCTPVLRERIKFRKLEPGMLTTLSSQFESLDYELFESDIFKEEAAKKTAWSLTIINTTRWIIMFFIGVFTALTACAIDVCIAEVSKLKYIFIKKYVDECVKEDCLYIPYFLWAAISTGFAIVAVVLVTYGEPVAAGSGIPQVKCYLNGINVLRLNRLKTLIVKALGVTCSALGGLAVGKEGPMVHSGAVIAAGISQGKSTTLGCDLGVLKEFRNDQEKRDFVTGGAAAGVAAAFGAPIGGVLFSMEEGSSFWNQNMTWRIFFCSMVSAFTLNVVLSSYHGKAGELAYDGLLNFGKFRDFPFSLWELPIFVSMGIIGGLSGALFNQMNYFLSVFRRRFMTSRWTKVVEVVVVCNVTVTVSFVMMYLMNDCKAITPNDRVEYPIQMFCPAGQYNVVAAIWFQTPEAIVRSLFHDEPGTHNPLSIGLFFVFYFLLSCWTYGLSISSGIFIPALLSGAAWGRLVGISLCWMSNGAAWADPGKYALIGAASQLGGIVRVSLSLAVILIETTGNLSVGLGLMLTLLTAKIIGDLFTSGIYDMHVQLTGLPMLPWSSAPLSHDTLVKHIMSTPVIVLNEIEQVARVIRVLQDTMHQGFPVVDGHGSSDAPPHFGHLCGFILRGQLQILLKEKRFCSSTGESDRSPIPVTTFRSYYPRYPGIQDMQFTVEETNAFIDLRPYYNPTPYTIPMNASLPRAFQLFRALGLRHLIVINSNNKVVGVITRKNLARYRARTCFGTIDFVELPVGGQGVELL